MTEIVPGLLWIGSAGEVGGISTILDAGIEALVDLAAEERPPAIVRDLIYCRVPLLDGGGNRAGPLRAAIEVVVSLLKERIPTLVYCGAGTSRSPAVAAAAVAATRGGSLDKILADIVAERPHDVSPALWEDIKRIGMQW